jgi:hypothetical protein
MEYLYALAERLPRRWRAPVGGAGAAAVVARPLRDLTVITSAVDAIPRPTSAALARHEEVAAAALVAEAVVPFPFGTVVPAPEVDDWLTGHLALVQSSLPKLRRRVEMSIKLVSLSPGARAPSSLRETAERLVEHAGVSDWHYHDGGIGPLVSAVAFLVARDGIADFLARVAPVAARAGDVAVVPTGPWAPSSFAPRLPPPRSSGLGPGLARAG